MHSNLNLNGLAWEERKDPLDVSFCKVCSLGSSWWDILKGRETFCRSWKSPIFNCSEIFSKRLQSILFVMFHYMTPHLVLFVVWRSLDNLSWLMKPNQARHLTNTVWERVSAWRDHHLCLTSSKWQQRWWLLLPIVVQICFMGSYNSLTAN